MNKTELLRALTERFVEGFDDIKVTNGDIIRALFPACRIKDTNEDSYFMEFTLDGVVSYAIEKGWWNALYNGENKR